MNGYVLHRLDCEVFCGRGADCDHLGHMCTCDGLLVMATLEKTLQVYMVADEPKRDAALRKLGLVR